MEDTHAPVAALDLLENEAAAVAPFDAAAIPDSVQWDACATHKDCDSCLNASVACHFCKSDFQCHAIGSPYGCAVGVSVCHHLEGQRATSNDVQSPMIQWI